MSVVKRPGRSSVAFVVALTLLLAFVVPFVGTALAGHQTDHDLDCTPENAQNATGTTHVITCTVSGSPQTNVEIDFEVSGANDPDDAESFTSPDFTCNTGGGNSCSFTLGTGGSTTTTGTNSSAEAGSSEVTAWIDDDQDNTTADLDSAEGPNAGNVGNTADETGASGTRQPGNVSEVDDTDVVLKTWFAAFSADATLDCTPETATNPATGPNSSEVYTCTLFDDNGAGGGTANNDIQDGSETRISGIRLDAEVGGDPNDPDNGTGTTADYNDACTTDANGQCQVTIPASKAQAGTTDICIWADPDADNQYDAGGDPNDGGECTTETDEDGNQTDIVSKTWVAPGTAVNLDAEPESDQNAVGTSHTMSATVTDINGAAVQGVEVDFIVSGRNAGDGCDGVTTNASGVANCTYTDVGTPIGVGFQTDTIDVCVDNDDDDNCDAGTEGVDVEDTDTTDAVEKFWFDAIPPTAQVVVDMNGCDGETPADAEATNSVGTVHEVCVSAYSNATTNTPLPGEQITVTLDGPGHFTTFAVWDDEDNRLDGVEGSEDLGDTITVTTDSNGDAFVYIYSEATGDTTVTATADGQSDTGTKHWTATNARVLDCSPESATNQINTTHTILCTAFDKFGNPVSGEDIDAVESGPGSITNDPSPCQGCTFYEQNNAVVYEYVTDVNGQFEIVTESGTEGTQTIEAAFDDDSNEGNGPDWGRATQSAGDDDDECDLNAGSSYEDGEHPAWFADLEDDARADAAGVCFDAMTKTWSTQPPTPAEGFPRTITLESSKNKLTYGNGFALTAVVTAGSTDTPASCVQGVTVTFQREIVGAAGSEIVGTATTDANGEASLALSADRSANYVASVDQTAECSDASSSAEAVLVKKKVKLKVSDQTPRRGGKKVRFKVVVLPCGGADGPGHEGDRAQLYKTVGGQLAKVAAKRTNDNCKAVFKRRVNKPSTFQGRSPKQDDDHLGGKSRKKAVQPHGRR